MLDKSFGDQRLWQNIFWGAFTEYCRAPALPVDLAKAVGLLNKLNSTEENSMNCLFAWYRTEGVFGGIRSAKGKYLAISKSVPQQDSQRYFTYGSMSIKKKGGRY